MGTPRVGGIIVWGAVIIGILLMWMLSRIIDVGIFSKLDFLSRNQTLLPLLGLTIGAVIGLFEDMLEIYKGTHTRFIHGLSSKYLVSIIIVIGFFISLWFYFKLGVSNVYIPFVGDISLGFLFIPFFILVMLGTFSSRVIDGIDGLAGGVLATIFTGFSIIAFTQNQIDLSAFSAVVTGGIMAFLWFNVPPARFYMGETGMLALTITLTIIAFLTDKVVLLLVIGFPLVATSVSSLIQITSKKYFNKKVFKIAPLHHHFEAIGWSRSKITMRYWIFSIICMLVGVLIAVVG
jgi:phospho-N-acetylmuramoyl-pentapeptide-transferase